MEQRIHSSSAFAKFFDERRAHVMVAENGAAVALGGSVQFDFVVLDGGGFQPFSDTASRPALFAL